MFFVFRFGKINIFVFFLIMDFGVFFLVIVGINVVLNWNLLLSVNLGVFFFVRVVVFMIFFVLLDFVEFFVEKFNIVICGLMLKIFVVFVFIIVFFVKFVVIGVMLIVILLNK